MMVKDNRLSTDTAEVVHAMLKVGLGAIPYAGSAASEVFDLLFQSPVSKRRDQWIVEIAEGLNIIENKIQEFSIKKLAENEEFISLLLQASHIAMRTHQEEKLLALKNAVLNTAEGVEIGDVEQSMFINLIDRLTPLHIKLLVFFKEPTEYLQDLQNQSFTSISQFLHMAFPNEEMDLIEVVMKDLAGMNLLPDIGLRTMMTSSGVTASRTTSFGIKFLGFIMREGA